MKKLPEWLAEESYSHHAAAFNECRVCIKEWPCPTRRLIDVAVQMAEALAVTDERLRRHRCSRNTEADNALDTWRGEQ